MTLTGRDVEVGADLGRVSGRNLFHSFERFGVGPGGRVTFTGPEGLDNVVSRVTGGEASRIDGTLASRVPGADVWLVNPSGIVFGPGARLDVPGSFHAGSADEVRFADGATFSARDPSASSLSVAAPEAFGFLGGVRPGAITIGRSVLEVPDGEALSLVGGDVDVRGGGILPSPFVPGSADLPGTVRARGGVVRLVGVDEGGGSVGLAAEGDDGEASGGRVRLAAAAQAVASGDGGGRLLVRAGELVVEGGSAVAAENLGASAPQGGVAVEAGRVAVTGAFSQITGSARGGGAAGGVAVRAGTVGIAGERAQIRASAFGAGRAGLVRVEAGTITVSGRDAAINSSSDGFATGNAGAVEVVARDSLILRDSGQVRANTFGVANAGAVRVEVGSLLIEGRDEVGPVAPAPGIRSASEPNASGNAGSITVEANDLTIRGFNALISTSSAGGGNAGEITVNVVDRLSIVGIPVVQELTTGITSRVLEDSLGRGGRVTVRADTVEVDERGLITASTFAPGRGGTVLVEAEGVTVRDGASIGSTTGRGGGAAGTVTVRARDRLMVSSSGQISSSSLANGGDAGSILVEADVVDVVDQGQINSLTRSGGRGGAVTVRAGSVIVRSGARINAGVGVTDAGVPGTGPGGTVTVVARDHVLVRDGGQIRTGTSGLGRAGSVDVDAPRIVVREDGAISSSGEATDDGGPTGPAGDVSLRPGVLLVEGGAISTRGASNVGGRITIDAEDAIGLVEAEVTSDGAIAGERTGLITMRAPAIALADGSRVTSLNADGRVIEGSGEAEVDGDLTFVSEDSLIAATTAVEVTGIDNEVGAGLQLPPGSFLAADSLLGQSCAARRPGGASSFGRAGRGGLAPSPDRPLASPRAGAGGGAGLVPGPSLLAAACGEGS